MMKNRNNLSLQSLEELSFKDAFELFNVGEKVDKVWDRFDFSRYFDLVAQHNEMKEYTNTLLESGYEKSFIIKEFHNDISNFLDDLVLFVDEQSRKVQSLIIDQYFSYNQSTVEDLSVVDGQSRYLWDFQYNFVLFDYIFAKLAKVEKVSGAL